MKEIAGIDNQFFTVLFPDWYTDRRLGVHWLVVIPYRVGPGKASCHRSPPISVRPEVLGKEEVQVGPVVIVVEDSGGIAIIIEDAVAPIVIDIYVDNTVSAVVVVIHPTTAGSSQAKVFIVVILVYIRSRSN
jgi:hypothetical protein